MTYFALNPKVDNMRFHLAVLFCALATSRADARDIYVNNISGDDRLDGQQAEASNNVNGPVRSITKALRLVLKGDSIVLAPTAQPYRESITLEGEQHSGYFGLPFHIHGNGAILDGSGIILPENWEFVAGDIFRFQPLRMAYGLMFLDGKPATRKVAIPGAGLPELAPLEWCLYDRHVYFRGETGKIPQHYRLTYTNQITGITLYKVHDVVIHDLTVQGFQLDGIGAADGVRDSRLISVTCRGNGRTGLCIGGGSRLEVSGCTLGDNGAAQLLLEDYCLARLFNSLLIGNISPEMVRRPGTQLWVDGNLVPYQDAAVNPAN